MSPKMKFAERRSPRIGESFSAFDVTLLAFTAIDGFGRYPGNRLTAALASAANGANSSATRSASGRLLGIVDPPRRSRA